MLILSRKKEEVILIVDSEGKELASVMVSEIYRTRVKLGITARDNLTVLRKELVDGVSTNEV